MRDPILYTGLVEKLDNNPVVSKLTNGEIDKIPSEFLKDSHKDDYREALLLWFSAKGIDDEPWIWVDPDRTKGFDIVMDARDMIEENKVYAHKGQNGSKRTSRADITDFFSPSYHSFDFRNLVEDMIGQEFDDFGDYEDIAWSLEDSRRDNIEAGLNLGWSYDDRRQFDKFKGFMHVYGLSGDDPLEVQLLTYKLHNRANEEIKDMEGIDDTFLDMSEVGINMADVETMFQHFEMNVNGANPGNPYMRANQRNAMDKGPYLKVLLDNLLYRSTVLPASTESLGHDNQARLEDMRRQVGYGMDMLMEHR